MKLVTLQRRMARAVMTPLTRTERMRPRTAAGGSMRAEAATFIKPNDRLTSFERLEIYNRQYWFRLLSSMIEDFAGLQAVLGSERFEQLCYAYLTDCPSRSFTLRNLGSQLTTWLKKHPRWLGAQPVLALDMCRLEWAHIEAFDGPEAPALAPEDLAEPGRPDFRLHLQPHLQLLSLQYPVDDLALAINDSAGDNSAAASNAVGERRKQRRVQAVARMKPRPIFLAVYRLENSVYYRRLQREEYALLAAVRRGLPLERCLVSAFRGSAMPAEDRPAAIEEWFHNLSLLGLFCRQPEDPDLRP